MQPDPLLESAIKTLSILIILFVVINGIVLWQRISTGQEKRNKRLTILISIGLLALAIAKAIETSAGDTAFEQGAESIRLPLEAASMLIFAIAFYLNLQKEADDAELEELQEKNKLDQRK